MTKIDVQTETILTLAQAAQHIPSRPHISTLHRWRTRGVRGIRLETILLGGKRATSIEALNRFYAAISAGNSSESVHSSASGRRELEIQRAEERLDDAGIRKSAPRLTPARPPPVSRTA